MLEEDAHAVTLCPDCGDSMILRVEGDSVSPGEAVVHFLVPPRQFWDDIGFT